MAPRVKTAQAKVAASKKEPRKPAAKVAPVTKKPLAVPRTTVKLRPKRSGPPPSGGAETAALEARLNEAREQQAATSEILRLMASSAGEVQPVLDAVAKWATRLCRSPFARVIMLVDGALEVVAHHSVDGEPTAPVLPIALERTSITGRAVLDRETVHYADLVPLLDTEFPEARGNVERLGARAVLAVPFESGVDVRGGIFLWRREPGLFAPDQVALVQTFARQAAIAIENVRLFTALDARNRELTEALEQQTATSEILRAISSSPTNVQPIFDIIAERAGSLCSAEVAVVSRFDGREISLAAIQGLVPEGVAILRALYPLPIDHGSISARVIRSAAVVHVADVLTAADYAPKDLARAARYRGALGVPIVRSGSVIGSIFVGRSSPGLFSDSQVELLKTFADQAVIAIENVRLFTELDARNRDLTEALEQQTATSEILRVISQSRTDVQPVFDSIAAATLELCGASSANVFTFDGKLIHLAALVNVNREYGETLRALFPRPPSRDTAATRAVLWSKVVSVPDVLADPEYAIASQSLSGGFRSVLAVPLLRGGSPIGVIAVGRSEPGSFPDNQIALLQTFADQAVIAIENVRLFTELGARNRELTEALEQQTATSEILRAISSSPTDITPVFETIAANALRLCDATFSGCFRFDGERIHIAALHHIRPEGVAAFHAAYPCPPSRRGITQRAVLTGNLVHVADVREDPEYTYHDAAKEADYRSVLSVPMLREGHPIGAITVFRATPGPYPASQVALLGTFADQAVIAVENVRLFTELNARNRELTEALDQQTATSDILRVISSSPTDLQPVFDAIARDARRLCDATYSVVGRYDGELLHLVAHDHVRPEGVEAIRKAFPMRPSRATTSSRAILDRAVVHLPDVLSDPDYNLPVALGLRNRSTLSAPMLRHGEPIGSISVGRLEQKPFTDKQIALLKTFAEQAVIAIENVRLFNELEARTNELTQSVGELKALGEVGQAVSSTLDLDAVLSTIVARATQLAGSDGGAIYEYDQQREEFHLRTAERYAEELVELLRANPIRKGEGALGQLAVVAEPVQIRDIANDRRYRTRVRDVLLRLGYRSALAIPLVREDHLLGGLVVNRASAGEFAPRVIELLKTFATQSALAIQNARLFRELADKSRELEIASRHKSEFLANMSHELRTPLNAIIGFSEVLADQMFGDVNAKQAEYLADILESGRHLLSLINDILDLSKIEAGRMELDLGDFSLPSAIDNTVTLVRERAHRRGITLERALDERVGPIRADERKVKQVLLNLLSNALKFTPEGGRISVRANLHDGLTEVSVTDTGVGISPQDQATVFEEFRQVGTMSKKVEGTGLGLAISRKFIELHGGKIWVTSEVGVGSTFAFTLPHSAPSSRATKQGPPA